MRTIVTIIFFSIVIINTLAALFLELRRNLTMLQQNSYRPERYRRWLSASGDSTSPRRLIAIAVLLMSMAASLTTDILSMLFILLVSSTIAVKLKALKYKKPLVMTRRAWRIASVMTTLTLIALGVTLAIVQPWTVNVPYILFVIAVVLLGVYCASHLITIAAVIILSPVEKAINRRFYRDAENILRAMPDLKVIGITGSYGKTSTKHYLQRILSERFETLMTPGSFNTTMGVIRTVREYLKPYTEVFIVEMGAKQPGDIAEICDLVKPQIGILTAVGPQHLETFKSIEKVQQTKFELIDSLPADGGFAVLNNDFEFIANRPVDDVTTVRYAIDNVAKADFFVENISYGPDGTTFFLVDANGNSTEFSTRLVGQCNVSNLAAAIVVARHLGMDDETIRYAVRRIEQVEHRLSIRRQPGGVVVIDDAFNSNPSGAAMALDVLERMTSGKRIVVTPGMVELGDRQSELNTELGRKIAKCADIAIIVNRYNRQALLDGCREEGMKTDDVITVDSFAEAQQKLHSILSPGDTVLYENDLPDTFK